MTQTVLNHAKQGVGTRLREARAARGFTQDELGRLAGFNQALVQHVEEGVLWNPTIISALAMVLDVTPAWIQWGEPFEKKRVK